MENEWAINSDPVAGNGEYHFTREQLKGFKATDSNNDKTTGTYRFSGQQLKKHTGAESNGKNYSLNNGVLTVFGTSKTVDQIKFRMLPQEEPVPEVEILILQEGIERIEDWTFANYSNLKKVVFPSTLKYIGRNSFCMCNSLQELSLPESVEEVGFCAFQECNALCRIKLPKQLRVLHGSAFFKDASLREVNIPRGITTLENGVFQECISLETVEIPEGVTEIEDFAFAGSGITRLELPSTLTKIGNMVFVGSALRELSVKNKDLVLHSSTGISDNVHVIGGAGTWTDSKYSDDAYTYAQEDLRATHKADTSVHGYGVSCPRCRSTNTTQTRRHRVFSIIKALVFTLLCPPLFLLGFVGSTRTECTCQSCGQTWTQKPGKFSLETLGEWLMYL